MSSFLYFFFLYNSIVQQIVIDSNSRCLSCSISSILLKTTLFYVFIDRNSSVHNGMVGVMVSALASSVVYRGFKSR